MDVVDFLIGVHEQDRAEIRWHTTWQHDAQNLANLVGLPTFPIAEAPEAPVSGIPNGVLEVARMRDGLPAGGSTVPHGAWSSKSVARWSGWTTTSRAS